MSKYRVPALVEREQHETIKRYAELTGQSVAAVTRQAIERFCAKHRDTDVAVYAAAEAALEKKISALQQELETLKTKRPENSSEGHKKCLELR